MKTVWLSILPVILVMTGSTANVNTSVTDTRDENKALYDTIAYWDSVLFTAFNNRDIETQKRLFSKDVEFYHDKAGLLNYDIVMENTRKNIELNNGLRRTLIPGSLEVYPIKDYGAVQIGKHQFCHIENGKNDCGTFKFVHVWQKKDGSWKLTRIISYDH